MALITCEPKDVDLLQLSEELGVEGVHVSYSGDQMLVEAKCTKAKLADGVDRHEVDVAAVERRAAKLAKERKSKEDEADGLRAQVDAFVDVARGAPDTDTALRAFLKLQGFGTPRDR